MKLVTVVITTYKRETKMLERALKSVFQQTYHPIEVIVVDDSPSDYELKAENEKMVKKYDDVKYISYESLPLGACFARNIGLKNANGDYIAFLDDDDEWVCQKIEKQVQIISRDDCALVYNSFLILNDVTNRTRISKTKFVKGDVFGFLECKIISVCHVCIVHFYGRKYS